MMKTALVVFASVVGVLQAQRYPTPPPPPPKAFQGSFAARHRPAGAGGVLGVHKAGVQSVSSSSLSYLNVTITNNLRVRVSGTINFRGCVGVVSPQVNFTFNI